MKLSKNYKYNILCEDKLTHCFIRRFLISQGISGRKINALPLPADGCGEQFVISSVLVVAIDADAKTCLERQKQLDDYCASQNILQRTQNDKLMLFIPRRNIETWVKYFDGEVVDEDHDYAHFLSGHESDCYNAADKMSEDFSGTSFTSELSSLQFAYKEYSKIITLIS